MPPKKKKEKKKNSTDAEIADRQEIVQNFISIHFYIGVSAVHCEINTYCNGIILTTGAQHDITWLDRHLAACFQLDLHDC